MEKVEVACAVCGTTAYRAPAKRARDKGRTHVCSMACRSILHSQREAERKSRAVPPGPPLDPARVRVARNGARVRSLGYGNDPEFPLEGVLVLQNGRRLRTRWTADGFSTPARHPDELDLVEV